MQRLQSFPKIVLGSKGQPKPELGQSSVAARSGIRVQVKNGRKGESFFQLVTLLIIKISVLIERMLYESVINSDLPLGNPGLPISAPYMEIISLQFQPLPLSLILELTGAFPKQPQSIHLVSQN